MSGFIQERLVQPIKSELKRGLDAEGLARSLTVGLLGGIFPIPGATAVCCYILHRFCRTNLVVVQLINLCITPFQLPFAVFAFGLAAAYSGEAGFDAGAFFSGLIGRLRNAPLELLSETGGLLLLTIAFWAVAAALLAVPVYLTARFASRSIVPSPNSNSKSKNHSKPTPHQPPTVRR